MTAQLTPDQLDRVHRHIDVLADLALLEARISGAEVNVPYIVMRAIAKVLVDDAVGGYTQHK